jgi:hypothetical protein
VEEKIKNLKHLTQGQLATNNMLSLPHLSTKNMNDKLGTINGLFHKPCGDFKEIIKHHATINLKRKQHK